MGEALPPKALAAVFDLALPAGAGRGAAGLDDAMRKVLRYSVNTWSPGFMDKLYASTDPVGVAADLLLSVLNTNVSTRARRGGAGAGRGGLIRVRARPAGPCIPRFVECCRVRGWWLTRGFVKFPRP